MCIKMQGIYCLILLTPVFDGVTVLLLGTSPGEAFQVIVIWLDAGIGIQPMFWVQQLEFIILSLSHALS